MKVSKITIIKTNEPKEENLNELLQWFGGTLGLFNIRDKDRSCFRVFIVLLKNSSKGLSSDEIADLTALSRGTIIYHINKLMEKGFVSEQSSKYYIKIDNLEELVTDIKKETDEAFNALKNVSVKIDKKLGLKK